MIDYVQATWATWVFWAVVGVALTWRWELRRLRRKLDDERRFRRAAIEARNAYWAEQLEKERQGFLLLNEQNERALRFYRGQRESKEEEVND